MLTTDDKPTIRNAILKRLDREPGVAVADIQAKDARDKDGKSYLQVGVWMVLTDTEQESGLVDLRGFFDLPPEFEIAHLHNEIDEIAEQCKAARLKAGIGRILFVPGKEQKREALAGTGLRGRWPQ